MNDFEKIYICSPSSHRTLHQHLIKCFSICIPINIILNNLNEEDKDVVIDEIVNDKNFEKIDTEVETYAKLDESKFLQEHEDGDIFSLDALNERKCMILEYKQCSNDLDKKTYLFFYSLKKTMNY